MKKVAEKFGILRYFSYLCNVEGRPEIAGVQSKYFSGAQEKVPECGPEMKARKRHKN